MEAWGSDLLERDEEWEWAWAHFSFNKSGFCSDISLAFRVLNLVTSFDLFLPNRLFGNGLKSGGIFFVFDLLLFLVLDFDHAKEEKDVEERETEDEEVDGILLGGILMGH